MREDLQRSGFIPAWKGTDLYRMFGLIMGKQALITCEKCGRRHFFEANSTTRKKRCDGIFKTKNNVYLACNNVIINTGFRLPEIIINKKPTLYKPRHTGKQLDLCGEET